MMTPIHTLESQLFGSLVLLFLGLGSFDLSVQVHSRLLKSNPQKILEAHVWTKGIIAMACLYFSPALFTIESSWMQLFSIFPIAIFGSMLCVSFEKKLIRRIYRQRLHKPKEQTDGKLGHGMILETQVRPRNLHLFSSKQGPSDQSSLKGTDSFNAFKYDRQKRNKQLIILLLIALAEELIFRGYLVQICRDSTLGIGQYFLILLMQLCFGFSHIYNGWTQVISKSLLGSVAFFGQFITGTVICSIFIHCAFNYLAWSEQGRRGKSSKI